MLVIDCHAHFVPREFPSVPLGVRADEWPVMVPVDDARSRMLIAGKEFRVFESAYWDIQGRIAYMDNEGIDLQVLSPLPELMSYWYESATAAAMSSYVNSCIAGAIAEAPKRLAGMGMLPMQDIEAAGAMVAEIAELGLRGVLVGSNVNGVSIADARFYPIFAALEARNMVLYVHGYRPTGMERFIGSPLLGPIAGVPQETAAAISSFIMTDILGKFPKLRICFAHGGGSFGAILPRMDHVWHEFPELQPLSKISPREYVKRFFYDTVTFGADYLQYLIAVLGEASLMTGTDGPTPIGQRGLPNFVAQATANENTASALLGTNAVRFFALEHMV